jgi:hypothetical protein
LEAEVARLRAEVAECDEMEQYWMQEVENLRAILDDASEQKAKDTSEVERLRSYEHAYELEHERATGLVAENERLRALVREAMGNVSADWFKRARQTLEEVGAS